MKRFYTLFLTLALLASLALPASGAAQGGVNITVDGVPVASDTAYISESGTTMVPLRLVAEALGCAVDWDPDTRTVLITTAPEVPEEPVAPELPENPELPEAPENPEEPEVLAPAKTPLVVIDPGHGGDFIGAEYGGIREKDLNLSIALQAAQFLEEAGIAVEMTRRTDEDIDLYARTEFANHLNADLFVSVHCNANVEHDDALGVYTCAYSQDGPGWPLAQLLHDAMIAATGAEDFNMEERPNLVVLRTSEMPAALVECGFMSTESELAMLARPEYQAMLARGIADGILAYLEQ